MKTLEQYLKTQDLGEKTIEQINTNYLNDNRGVKGDPISQIIVNAFHNSDEGTDQEQFEMDIKYAIHSLKKVLHAI